MSAITSTKPRRRPAPVDFLPRAGRYGPRQHRACQHGTSQRCFPAALAHPCRALPVPLDRRHRRHDRQRPRCRASCRELGAAPSQLQWISDAYTLVFAELPAPPPGPSATGSAGAAPCCRPRRVRGRFARRRASSVSAGALIVPARSRDSAARSSCPRRCRSSPTCSPTPSGAARSASGRACRGSAWRSGRSSGDISSSTSGGARCSSSTCR